MANETLLTLYLVEATCSAILAALLTRELLINHFRRRIWRPILFSLGLYFMTHAALSLLIFTRGFYRITQLVWAPGIERLWEGVAVFTSTTSLILMLLTLSVQNPIESEHGKKEDKDV